MAHRVFSVLIVLFVMAVPHRTAAQTAADSMQIVSTALDYIEGYYEGDAARMERALHPELAKRIVRTDPRSNRSFLGQMSALTLIQGTRDKEPTPAAERQNDVTILDVFGNTASVKIIAFDWVDYLHLAKWNDQWKIVNVLWEMKPRD